MNRRFLIVALFVLFFAFPSLAQQSVTVRVDRWLSIAQTQGSVAVVRGGSAGTAQVGARLTAVGDGVNTGANSAAVLTVDTGIGFVNVFQNTQIRVQALAIAPDDGRITRLSVPRGQVRLQLRRFTHRGSSLEIETPAGVSGVRGTDFGLIVQPDGKTMVATLTGSVETSAQGDRVLVPAGFQNFTVPGEPPSPATRLTNSTELRYHVDRLIENNLRRVRFVGQVDPVNTVLVGEEPQVTDRNGAFSLEFPARSQQRLQVTVVTPLGNQQVYELDLL